MEKTELEETGYAMRLILADLLYSSCSSRRFSDSQHPTLHPSLDYRGLEMLDSEVV